MGVFAGFYQLGRLDLSGNSLTSLDEEFFRGPGATLPLNSLDLSDNSLTSLPEELWFETRNLVSLDLSGNDLTNLRDGTFRYMVVYREGRLKTLDLSDNGLLHAPSELWDDDCFSRVANLTLSPGNPDLPACGESPALVYSATMTVGRSLFSTTSFGWSVGSDFLNDAITDSDFVYENETYEIYYIGLSTFLDSLEIYFDPTNNGSIADPAVRRLMTLYVDGVAFALGDATYSLRPSGAHRLTWENPGLTWAAGDNVQLDLTVTSPVWSATMTVGSGILSGLIGWDDGVFFGSDALSDADFVYDHETYEIYEIDFTTFDGELLIIFDATNSGSISDAAVRSVMTLYADGAAFALGDATYALQASGRSDLTWLNTGLTWAVGDTVELEIRVTR